MLMSDLKRIMSWFARRHHASAPRANVASGQQASILEVDPMWHGDHWQNLLSSPMDARHYVMEDWTTSATPESEGADSPGVRGARRRAH
ncbi:hypothetical protein FAZ69_03815 [Trinickia terrae]|uniref:Uncharacterized protein n=2 Tax=Trinickia terrae TaxID=2571161 RepID=A0A4U1IDV6_9BURK|nr:hypothetical protein FAZ69_03815 [Trinickia terrae]